MSNLQITMAKKDVDELRGSVMVIQNEIKHISQGILDLKDSQEKMHTKQDETNGKVRRHEAIAIAIKWTLVTLMPLVVGAIVWILKEI